MVSVLVLQPLQWRCVKCVIHHERDVREEQHQARRQDLAAWGAINRRRGQKPEGGQHF